MNVSFSEVDERILANYHFIGSGLCCNRQNRKENENLLSVKFDPHTHTKSLSLVRREDINAWEIFKSYFGFGRLAYQDFRLLAVSNYLETQYGLYLKKLSAEAPEYTTIQGIASRLLSYKKWGLKCPNFGSFLEHNREGTRSTSLHDQTATTAKTAVVNPCVINVTRSSWKLDRIIYNYNRVPTGLALHTDGNILICSGNRFSETGELILVQQRTGMIVKEIKLHDWCVPSAVAVGSSGTIYVTDFEHKCLYVLDANGMYLTHTLMNFSPRLIAIGRDGEPIVVARESPRDYWMHRFAADGAYKGKAYGAYYTINDFYGTNQQISNIAVNSSTSDVAVYMPREKIIRLCTHEGVFIKDMHFDFPPTCFTFDAVGSMIVCFANKVELFNSEGNRIASFGDGTLKNITHVQVNRDGQIIIADRGRITLWSG